MDSLKINIMKQIACSASLAAGLFIGAAFLLPPSPARAQACDAIYETITALYPPRLGFPTVWDTAYTANRQADTELFSSIPYNEDSTLSFGRAVSPDTGAPYETFLVNLNKRGRVIQKKAFAAGYEEMPVKLLNTAHGLMTLSTIMGNDRDTRHSVLLRWHDEDFAVTQEKILKDDNSNYHYTAQSMVPALEGDGIIAILQATKHDDPTERHGLLMRIDHEGKILWQRFYRPGIPNKIASLYPIDSLSYLATGEIQSENGPLSGWALKLGHDGTIFWQRSYPRGAGATLKYGTTRPVLDINNAGFVVAGTARPLDEGPEAAWIMALDLSGEPLWQRYYRRDDYHLSSLGIIAQDDGRLVAPLQALMLDKDDESPDYRSHIRILTLSPRGAMMSDESYIEGLRAIAKEALPFGQDNRRLITATIEDDTTPSIAGLDETDAGSALLSEDLQEEDNRLTAHKGWVLVTPGPDPYTDPCIDQPNWP